MRKEYIHNTGFLAISGLLLYSFIGHESWLELCSGLAFFLFGMQCMKEGLQKLAGGKLEQLLAKNTATPFKGMIFGIGSTIVLQSTTVVSLLTIAFISTSLITLAGGIAIILGANLGASSGVWLLALAGQSISLGPFAYPMIVFAVLASFNGKKFKALGRVILGIAFILLAIDLIKTGFSSFTAGIDFTVYDSGGAIGMLAFVLVGLIITVILQSSHATVMLILTALGAGQVAIEQAFSLAIGANIGSAVTTGIMGFIGGDQGGKRLALAHVLFNVVTGILAILFLPFLVMGIEWLTQRFMLNNLIQLAIFHTAFNMLGVLAFWFFQNKLANYLMRVIPEEAEQKILIAEVQDHTPSSQSIRAKYLTDTSRSSTETAVMAIFQELLHIERMSIEVICCAMHLPLEQLSTPKIDEKLMRTVRVEYSRDADDLYKRYIKGIYSDLLIYIGGIEIPKELTIQHNIVMNCQIVALQLVDAVKNAKHLQKNMALYIKPVESVVGNYYIDLRIFVLIQLRAVYQIYESQLSKELSLARLKTIQKAAQDFENNFRDRIFTSVNKQKIDRYHTSSLINDLNYAVRIVYSLCKVSILSYDAESDMLEDEFSETPHKVISL